MEEEHKREGCAGKIGELIGISTIPFESRKQSVQCRIRALELTQRIKRAGRGEIRFGESKRSRREVDCNRSRICHRINVCEDTGRQMDASRHLVPTSSERRSGSCI